MIFSDCICKEFLDLYHYFNHQINQIENNYLKITYVLFSQIENLDNGNSIRQYLKTKYNEIDSASKKNMYVLVLWDDMIEISKRKLINSFNIKAEIQEMIKNLGEKVFHFFAANELFHFQELKECFNMFDFPIFDKNQLKFTGRIMVDLSDDSQEIRYELNEPADHFKLYLEPLLLTKRALNSAVVYPSLSEFASKRGIDFILLMDQEFLLANNAFDESKVKENINEKMQEFNNYEKSLLIIDFDSLVGVSKSTSTSSMGVSTSYNVSDPKIYNLILHYATSLASISLSSEYWVALIIKNSESAKFVNLDIHFPKTEATLINELEELEMKKDRKCIRCMKIYNEEKNEIDSCLFHNGPLIQISDPPYNWKLLSIEEAKDQAIKHLIKNKEKDGNQFKEAQFIYLCCDNPMNGQGCINGKHIIDENLKKEDMKKNWEKFNERFENFKKLMK